MMVPRATGSLPASVLPEKKTLAGKLPVAHGGSLGYAFRAY
jgi:hypothetical protein